MTWRGRLLRAAAVLAVPAAIVLLALAVDVLRVPRELEGDDVRFEAAPRRQQGLWADAGYLPGGLAESGTSRGQKGAPGTTGGGY
jgi:hypothetical protein